jgi:hypothetical protein
MNRFFNAIRWTDYYWLQQWTMDNWQLTMRQHISIFLIP